MMMHLHRVGIRVASWVALTVSIQLLLVQVLLTPHHLIAAVPTHANPHDNPSEQTLLENALNAHRCAHDADAHHHSGTVSGRGLDIAIPQAYDSNNNGRPPPPATRREQHQQASSSSSSRASPSVRIVVSAEDVLSETRTCRSVGQETMDFIGGSIRCTDANDILSAGKVDALLVHALPVAIARISKAVGLLRPVASPLTTFRGACPYVTVPSAQLSGGVADADLALYVTAAKTHGTTIAWAGYCGVDQFGRPILARMNVGSQYLPSNWSAIDALTQERLIRVLEHELVHTLGFTYDYMQSFLPRSLLSTVQHLRGKDHPVVVWVGSNAVAAAQSLFQCPSQGFVELEDQGGAGTALSHLERHTFFQDLMTGISGTTWRSNQLSTITLGILKDFGHYDTVASDAEPVVWGNASGCDMLTEPCLNATDQRVPASMQPFFCTSNTSDTIDTLAALATAYRAAPPPTNATNQTAAVDGVDVTTTTTTTTTTEPPSGVAANESVWRQRLLAATDMASAAGSTVASMHSQCTIGHLDAGSCRLYQQNAPLPRGMQYYGPQNPNLGGNVSLVDYCPVPMVSSTLLGHPERPRCYDPSVPAPGVWAVTENDGSSLGGLSFRGPHGACLNVLVLTANTTMTASPSDGTATGATNSTTKWTWEHTTKCAELRCLWNRTTAGSATLSVEWRATLGTKAPDDDDSAWQRCTTTDIATQPSPANDTASNSSRTRWVWWALSNAPASAATSRWTFAECPDAKMVCVGELLSHAVTLTGPPTPSPPTTTTTTTSTTSSTTTPTTTSTRAPTTAASTHVPTTTTATTLQPPPPPTTAAPLPTPPPAPVAAIVQVKFRCSGMHWDRVLNDTSGRRPRLQHAVARMFATALNLTEQQVNVTQMSVGSLVATLSMSFDDAAQGTAATAAIDAGHVEATVNTTGLAGVYAEVANDTSPIVLSLMSVGGGNGTLSSGHAPAAAATATTLVAHCVDQGWCVAAAVVVLLVVVGAGAFAAIRRLCCHTPDAAMKDAADAAGKASFRAEDGLGPASPPPVSKAPRRGADRHASSLSGRGEGAVGGRRISIVSSIDRQSSMTPQSTTVTSNSLRGFGSDGAAATSEVLSVDAASPQLRRPIDRVAWGSSVESSPTTAQATPRSATEWQPNASPRTTPRGSSFWGRRRR